MGAGRQAAQQLRDRLDELAEAWLDEMWAREEFSDWARPELRDAARDNARADIGREISYLEDGAIPPARAPEEVAASARMAARNDFPLSGVLQSYRTGHAVQWRAWQRAVFGLGLDDSEAQSLLGRGSDFFFAYADLCCRAATQIYAEERERQLRSDERRRRELVRRVLDGASVEPGTLGYDLSTAHLAIVARGAEREAALAGLAEELGAERLSVDADDLTTWAWLGRDSWPEGADPLRRFSPPPEVRLAAGRPGGGEDGFRRSHRQALLTDRAAGYAGDHLTLYDEAGLVGLLCADEAEARGFATDELGALLGDGARAGRLRHTLRAYLKSAQHASSAAAALGVHQRTVANHIRAIEDTLGRSVAHRATELGCALRVYEALGFEDDADADPPLSKPGL